MELGTMTREQVASLPPDTLAIVPVGSMEQHGYHLPTSTDTLLARTFADQLALEVHEYSSLVLPPIPFGYSPHHFPYAGTVSVGSSILREMLVDIGRSVSVWGLRRLLFINGHGGNEDIVRLAAREIAYHHHVIAGAVSYWVPGLAEMRQDANDVDRHYPMPGHAGRFETALMLHFYHSLVNLQYIPEGLVKETHRENPYWFHPDGFARFGGFSDDPRGASAVEGSTMADVIVRNLIPIAHALYGNPK